MDGLVLDHLRYSLRDETDAEVRDTMRKLLEVGCLAVRCIFQTRMGSNYFVGKDGASLRFKHDPTSGLYTVSPAVASTIVFLPAEAAEALLKTSKQKVYELLETQPIQRGICMPGAVPLEVGYFGADTAQEEGGNVRVHPVSFLHIGHPVARILRTETDTPNEDDDMHRQIAL